MPYATFLLRADVALIVHAARTGRFTPWAYVIMFLPGVGAPAYVVVELLPEWPGAYKGRQAQISLARHQSDQALLRIEGRSRHRRHHL